MRPISDLAVCLSSSPGDRFSPCLRCSSAPTPRSCSAKPHRSIASLHRATHTAIITFSDPPFRSTHREEDSLLRHLLIRCGYNSPPDTNYLGKQQGPGCLTSVSPIELGKGEWKGFIVSRNGTRLVWESGADEAMRDMICLDIVCCTTPLRCPVLHVVEVKTRRPRPHDGPRQSSRLARSPFQI